MDELAHIRELIAETKRELYRHYPFTPPWERLARVLWSLEDKEKALMATATAQ